jgi:hypothetical protein
MDRRTRKRFTAEHVAGLLRFGYVARSAEELVGESPRRAPRCKLLRPVSGGLGRR